MGKKWIPLEANPEVLNEFAQKLGVSLNGYEFCDIYGLDEVCKASTTVGMRLIADSKLHLHR